MCGGARGEIGEKAKVWTGGAWSLVRIQVWTEKGEERTGAFTGKEPRTLSSASSEKTRVRGRSVGKLIWERG